MYNADKPAYPIWTDDMPIEGDSGLTKREKIAAMAMQGCLAMGCECQGSDEELAKIAVKKADSLLKELDQ